ncbi:MAG: serine protease [Myxococcota bacterium]|nr:serine protease [Myxococcota bacterium]
MTLLLPRTVLVSLLILAAGCATAPGPTLAAAARIDPAPTVALAAHPVQPPSRREVIRGLLAHNVRVLVYEGESAKRTASGVVLAVSHRGAAPVTYVITNAHVVDPQGLSSPRYTIKVDRRGESTEYPARLVAQGTVPQMDLGVVSVEGLVLPAAPLASAEELELGEDVIVAAAPYGRPISLSGGMIAHLDWDPQTGLPRMLKTDAAIGYGASGGGVYSVTTGRLMAIVEGYRTAKVSFAVAKEDVSFDVPMPGETFAAPTPKIRAFLQEKNLGWILEEGAPEKVAAR